MSTTHTLLSDEKIRKQNCHCISRARFLLKCADYRKVQAYKRREFQKCKLQKIINDTEFTESEAVIQVSQLWGACLKDFIKLLTGSKAWMKHINWVQNLLIFHKIPMQGTKKF